ncbi:glycosyltransferase family 39 protein [Romeria aff. gracilis LEGE 07310]|uniref:Glycosyltransferase family 39 protein n=1 Tax=Vasconcelosia minhoensis LEGE 07310 TaxID=915328 RepID=A0A8J7DRL9_9CYAN|nr:glycosyltransferase family 39 protein [Romeria gracilis]MBE9078844.1 glycosyltransferase family 39 protein [Romeria aff. gracilis LEGE 07310]
MKARPPVQSASSRWPLARWLIVSLMLVGVFFRIATLDQRVYWVDEVATSVRASGYPLATVVEQVTTGAELSRDDLLQYQRLSPERTWSDTLSALSQNPEHAPLYFLIVRGWAEWFGSSVVAIRSLSVGFGLLVLPALYGLCQRLFSAPVGGMAVALFSVSPFFVAYAQEARPYSLWTLLLVLSCGSLLSALERDRALDWLAYALAATLGLYTSILTTPVLLAQGLYVGLLRWPRSKGQSLVLGDRVSHYLLVVGSAIALFSPWLWVIYQQRSLLQANVVWMQQPLSPALIVGTWLYSLVILFFDCPVVPEPSVALAVEAAIALAVLGLLGAAFFHLCRTAPRRVWLLLIAFSLSTLVPLALIDLITGGQASATPRYLIPAQLGGLIAVAHWLTTSPWRRRLAAGLIGLSLVSCWVGLAHTPDYLKTRSRSNGAIAARLGQASNPLLIAESAQTFDLLSLSHSLRDPIGIRILPMPQLPTDLDLCRPTFLLSPSAALQTNLPTNARLEPAYQPRLLTAEDRHLALWQLISGDPLPDEPQYRGRRDCAEPQR